MLVYKFTSPLLKDYIKKKILMFSIPSPVMEFSGNLDQLKEFEDVKVHQNVVFALSTQEPELIKQYHKVAAQYRERFFFFLMKPDTTPQTENNHISYVHAIGHNFTKNYRVAYVKKNPSFTSMLIEKAI